MSVVPGSPTTWHSVTLTTHWQAKLQAVSFNVSHISEWFLIVDSAEALCLSILTVPFLLAFPRRDLNPDTPRLLIRGLHP